LQYVLGDGRVKTTGFGNGLLARHTDSKVFSLQYRLSSESGGRFPAALQDIVTAYQHLLDLGIPPSKIAVSGDSAGAHLVLSLLRYISEHEGLLPPPAAAFLWSPWVKMAGVTPETIDNHANISTDYLCGEFIMWGINTFVPPFMEKSHPYISPLGNPFKTKTPIWIHTGGCEVLYDDDVQLANEMQAVGNEVELYVEPNASHDIWLVGNVTGFEAETVNATKMAGEFMKKQGIY
jgi:acetyl esterase/lipase